MNKINEYRTSIRHKSQNRERHYTVFFLLVELLTQMSLKLVYGLAMI